MILLYAMQPRSSITTIALLTLALLVVANIVWFHTPLVGVPAFFFLLLGVGARIGTFFFSNFAKTIRTCLGMLLALAWIMVLGSIFYYVAVLNIATISLILVSLPLATLLCRDGWLGILPRGTSIFRARGDGEEINGGALKIESEGGTNIGSPTGLYERSIEADPKPGPVPQRLFLKMLLCIAFTIFLAPAFRLLGRVYVYDSIRSPWEALPSQFFWLVFLAAAALITLALRRSRLAIALAIPFFFLFYSVTALTYPLGYGFDPFIHQTTESYIAEHGTITPKPFTYIGQYALVVTTHRATALSIPAIDRWLLPILLAIFLPIAGWAAFREPLAAVLLPILPMNTFAVTTPQAIGNALVLITVLLALATRDSPRRALLALWLLGLAAALTHPIAGIPLLIFIFLWSLQKPGDHFLSGRTKDDPLVSTPNFKPVGRMPSWFDPLRSLLTVVAILGGAVILPALFALYGLVSGTGVGIRSDALTRIPSVLANLGSSLVAFQSRFNFLLDFVYLYGLNLAFLLVAVSILVLFSMRHKMGRSASFVSLMIFVTALVTFANGVLLDAAIDFSFLPLYEQSGYAERLFDIAKLFLLPIFVIGLAWGIRAVIKKHGLVVRVGAVALCAGLLTTSLYLMYPHPDAYTVERGFNVGAADFETVQFIEQDAADEPHIVLANQAVSAAALKEFGFKQYFNFQTEDGSVTSFYYPIPTGGPLYDYYLKMVYDAPRAATIREAMDRAGINLSYFVVNRYWYQSEKIIEQAKGQTTSWWQFGNGAVHVFKFHQ